ncbi:MAG: NADPH:quinone oxidoreductase family protein [Pseudomonadota bacterium]|nr:NADPH:quinone oxidoreductase family protein [Pseudomonadota bacterium]
MRAVVITDTSNRGVSIREVADPLPGDTEVLIEVKACGVNFTDLLSLDGKYQNNPDPPFTPGKDAAGIVSAVGNDVTSHKAGDRVIAHVIHGAMATKAVCPATLAFPLPDSVKFETAAAMGLAYLTGYLALSRRGQLKAGDAVLINGASGGVGLASVSLAKALGAGTVLAGLTTPSKAGRVIEAGADAVIDLSVEDLKSNLRQQVMTATNRRGIDLVFDLVGGEVFDATLRVIANEGRAVVSGFTSGTIPAVRTNYLLLKNIAVVGSTINYYIKQGSPLVGEAQSALFELLDAGKIDPNIMVRLPFEKYMDGIKLLEDRKIIGKAVLLMD